MSKNKKQKENDKAEYLEASHVEIHSNLPERLSNGVDKRIAASLWKIKIRNINRQGF